MDILKFIDLDIYKLSQNNWKKGNKIIKLIDTLRNTKENGRNRDLFRKKPTSQIFLKDCIWLTKRNKKYIMNWLQGITGIS